VSTVAPTQGVARDLALFLFAHQDDEFGVFGELSRLRASGHRIVVVYLTSGNPTGNACPVREKESIDVLEKLGVARADVHFVGANVGIADAHLCEHTEAAYAAVQGLVESVGRPTSLYSLAWEGGHQDHDAAHLVGLALANELGILDRSFQFPLYTGDGLPGWLFKLCSPLVANGPVSSFRMTVSSRIRFIRFALSYPSQALTWLGLFPSLLFHYTFRGTQLLQGVSLKRVAAPPHPGTLLYERRRFYTYAGFRTKVAPFCSRRLGIGSDC
jgi:hypothetical protein